MPISFFAYHGNAEQRRAVINAMADQMARWAVMNANERGDDRPCLISGIAGGEYDLAVAHRNCGFPAPLLLLAEAIFKGLTADDAPEFALALVQAATVDADLADVAWAFVEWMFADAVATFGPSTIRAASKSAEPALRELVDLGSPAPAERQAARAEAKKMRRRGLDAPTGEQKLVAHAVGAISDGDIEDIGKAIHWIAHLSDASDDQYRRYARRLLELVEAA